MEGRDLFVPIVGERVDAHRFICQAISAGAETVFTSCHHSEKEVREAIESQCREHPEWSGQALLSTLDLCRGYKSGSSGAGSLVPQPGADSSGRDYGQCGKDDHP